MEFFRWIAELDVRDLIDTPPQPVMQRILRHATSTLRGLRGNDLQGVGMRLSLPW
jgi:hypothetical protein